jgi:hypothetical protein
MGLFSKTFSPIKAMASSDFMDVVGKAKKDAQAKLDTNIESFEQSLRSAVNMFSEFSKNKDSEMLKEIGIVFLNLIEQKPSRVEPYVYMAYILFLFNKKEEALKYIRISESIDRDYHKIKAVKACILTN